MSGFLCSMVGVSSVVAAAEVIRYKKGIVGSGGAVISTSQSKFGGTSAYFDGTDDHLVVYDPSGSMNFGTSTDFTVEMWARFSATNNTRILWSSVTNGVLYTTSGVLNFYSTQTGAVAASSSPTANTWAHIALSRSGSTTRIFLNGTQVASTSTSPNISNSGSIYIARESAGNYFNGFIDEFRISKTARYTANFTSPTAAFVNDDNTVLLIHANGTNNATYFEDDNGTVRDPMNGWQGGTGMSLSTTQSKFGGTSLYVSTNDNDIYHNQYSAGGTGNALINFGTGNFTVEFWIYPNSSNTNTTIGVITKRNYSSTDNGTWGIRYNASNRVITWENIFPTVTSQSTSTSAFTFNTWSHWAFVRNSGTLKIYVDGVEKSSASNSLDFTYYSQPLRIGQWGDGGSNGLAGAYLDEIRISNTARYTAGFTPSTTPFVNDSNTLLLLHMDGASSISNIHDDNGEGRSQKGVLAVGNAQISTSQSKFGGTSAYFDGTDDALSIADNSWMNFGSSDFTAECWFRWSGGTLYPALINTWSENASNRNFFLGIDSYQSKPIFYFVNSAGTINTSMTSSTSISTNTWYHLAICGDATNFKLYLNGTQVSSLSRQTLRAPVEVVRIGNTADLAQDFNGYIDEVRVSNIVRYTADFTPSTTPFAPDSNTLLLLHMDGTNASTVFIDDNGRRTYTP